MQSYYGQDSKERLSAFTMNFHYLLHVEECIKSSGPCWNYWQFPLERMIGMLQPMVHNKHRPYTNLVNNIELWEMFNHITFLSNLGAIIYPPTLPKHFQNDSVFYFYEDKEQLWWPRKHITLSDTEFRHLRAWYNIHMPGQFRADQVC